MPKLIRRIAKNPTTGKEYKSYFVYIPTKVVASLSLDGVEFELKVEGRKLILTPMEPVDE